MIQFYEHDQTGYALRTWENAKRADLTIAFAIDFDTAGEKLTRKAAYGKYLGIDINDIIPEADFTLQTIWETLKTLKPQIINFAGNGAYTLKKHSIDQDKIDVLIEIVMLYMLKLNGGPFAIRSGGQTGVDEAALKAGDKLGLETICLAPKHWLFRDERGIDIMSEQLFLKRFGYDVMDIL